MWRRPLILANSMYRAPSLPNIVVCYLMGNHSVWREAGGITNDCRTINLKCSTVLVLHTGTLFYSKTCFVALIYQNQYFYYSPFNIYFYIFCTEQCWKLDVTFVLFWTVCFHSFAQARDCHNAQEIMRFPVEKMCGKTFSYALAQ